MRRKRPLLILLAALAISGQNACGVEEKTVFSAAQPLSAPAQTNDEAGISLIRVLEKRIKSDPDNFSANSQLAGLYLQKLRETGDVTYLDLAFRAARSSLQSVPEIRNTGGLAALAQAHFAAHDFSETRDLAIRLMDIEPAKVYPLGILGDAYLELGEYDNAEASFKKMAVLEGGMGLGSETRFARLSQLRGDNAGARKHLSNARIFARDLSAPPRETIAWLEWQMGENSFSASDYSEAEKHYKSALEILPDYYRAIGSLARLFAARGDMQGAIAQLEKVVRLIPDPGYVALLGDLYMLSGRRDDAGTQYALVEQIGRLSDLNGVLYNRQLALFYADHDLNADTAYRLATEEYKVRKDIYSADAVAWASLKLGKIEEAQAAMAEALKLGTKDAKLYYHAGMINAAAGDRQEAIRYLGLCLKTNPGFDLQQAQNAKGALSALR